MVVEEEKSHEAEILEFTVPGQIGKAEIGENTVKAVMKAGTNLSSLAPVIKVSEGAKISPASGSTQDFSQPVKYTVTAEDSKTTREYTVTLTVGGEVVLDTSAEPAAGVTLSGNNYTVVAGGAAAATTVKVSLTYSGSPIAGLHLRGRGHRRQVRRSGRLGEGQPGGRVRRIHLHGRSQHR